jgi:uncharacterized protein YndB with AHSA1/START domain
MDTSTAESTVEIAADPAAVWDLILDVDLPARFSEEFQGGLWLDEPGLGSRFAGQNRRGPHQWQTTCTVIQFEPERTFAYAVEDTDNPAAVWRFTLDPIPTGTAVTMWAQMGPGPSGVSNSIERTPEREEEIIATRLAEWHHNIGLTLAGLKHLAEAG